MLGVNIDRNISPNKPKDDEIAYVNRMRIHIKNSPGLVGRMKENYSNLGFTVRNFANDSYIFFKFLFISIGEWK